jgi:hypothetical protein
MFLLPPLWAKVAWSCGGSPRNQAIMMFENGEHAAQNFSVQLQGAYIS